jgi:hypothetical protein
MQADVRLALNQLWDIGGQHGQESEEGEGKEEDRQEEKEVVSPQDLRETRQGWNTSRRVRFAIAKQVVAAAWYGSAISKDQSRTAPARKRRLVRLFSFSKHLLARPYAALNDPGAKQAPAHQQHWRVRAPFDLPYCSLFNTVGTTWIRSAAIEASVERLITSWFTQLRFSVAWGPANTLNELLIGNLRQEPRRRDVKRRYRTSRHSRGRRKFG